MFSLAETSMPHLTVNEPGFLFKSDGAALRVADGSTLELGGQQWHVRFVADGLELSTKKSTDNERQQATLRRTGVRTELEQRKLDVETLRTQVLQMMASMEEVALLRHTPHLHTHQDTPTCVQIFKPYLHTN